MGRNTNWNRSHLTAWLVAASIALGATNAGAAPTDTEQKCLTQLGNLATKLATTVAKELSRCRSDDLSGTVVGSCPNAGNLTKISTIATKLVAAAGAKCGSYCFPSSTVACVANAMCPPTELGINEMCNAGASSKEFDLPSIGFPGPYCEEILGGPISNSDDIGECAQGVAEQAAENLIDNIYGSLTSPVVPSAQARTCLSAVSKAAQKVMKTTAKGVHKCRSSINKGKALGDPKKCATSDAKLAAKISKAIGKLDATVEANCADVLAEIDICGAGIGVISTIENAKSCLAAAAQEAADSPEVPVNRLYSNRSVIDATYPPTAICGNGVVDQLPSGRLLLGEECDGGDDSECPTKCLPPGDLFECTCGDRPRLRAFADGPATDSDAGWTGISHDQPTADRSGYVVDLLNCQCDGFTDADCTGGSSDPVCDQQGIQTPFCSWDTTKSVRCDTVGTAGQGSWGNLRDENSDCMICDENSLNAGVPCRDSTDCQSQCYDAEGAPQGPCDSQADCQAGEVCRGRCDETQRCVKTPNGAPLPVGAANAAVCNVQTFREAVTGTRNIVTGENETYFKLFSVTNLGENGVERPCPVCGGFCVSADGNVVGGVCQGRCEQSGGSCRFDSDCPGVGEKCSEQSPDCPNGFTCELDLICGADPENNSDTYRKPCAIDYVHPSLGAISNDCLPAATANISDQGFRVNHSPTGSELKTLAFAVPCTATGFQLYDCPCPSDGGAVTKPNNCRPACDAGVLLGDGCADGQGAGAFTTCSAGSNAGKNCDEDSDCPGGLCNQNPTHCVGDPSFEHFPCASNGDCGTGACVNACPAGRCVPLCLPEAGDPEDGECAAGPSVYRCADDRWDFVECSATAAAASCAATCSVSATPCDSDDDCPSGETCEGSCQQSRDCEAGTDGILGTGDDKHGAGPCIEKPLGCILDPISVEGGDTLNGKGSNTNYLRSSIWCFGKTNNPGVNATAGFGGPGVLRERGTNVINVDSIP